MVDQDTETAKEKIRNKDSNYELSPPTIYESELFPDSEGEEDKPNATTFFLNESNIINFSGPRGGGKTSSLTWFSMKALAGGLGVWLNFPVEFYIIWDKSRSDNKRERLKAEILNLKTFLAGKTNCRGGLIGLDEYQDIASAYSFNATKNRILAATWAQIRKDDMSFYYTSKFAKWVDARTRDELDLEFCCIDAVRTAWGRRRYKKGEMTLMQMRDWSGNLTMHPFEQFPRQYPCKLYRRMVWGAYPQKFKIDIFESMRGIQLDLQKDVISDRDKDIFESIDDQEALCDAAQKLFDKMPRWKPTDFFYELGIYSQRDKSIVKKILRDRLGITEGSPAHPVFELGTRYAVEREKELVPA